MRFARRYDVFGVELGIWAALRPCHLQPPLFNTDDCLILTSSQEIVEPLFFTATNELNGTYSLELLATASTNYMLEMRVGDSSGTQLQGRYCVRVHVQQSS